MELLLSVTSDLLQATSLDAGAIVGIVFGVIAALVLGGMLGAYFGYKFFKKQLKKNPPITENQVRAMYAQMGRKPSEQQVRQVMAIFKRQMDNKKK